MSRVNASSAQVIRIQGNHYQMGYQHGRQVQSLRPYIIKAIEARFVQLEQDGADEAFEMLVGETHQVLQKVDPLTVDIIRGLADGLALEFDQLMRYNLAAFLRDVLTTRQHAAHDREAGASEGCTTWAATGSATVHSYPILVKNRDYNLEHLPLQVVVQAEPEVGYRYTYVTSAGSPGVFVAGFNEAGLAVADTHVSSTDVGPGLPTYALSMHVLEEHRTVRSALTYLQATPRLGRNNLLLADATGDIALFEIGHHHSAVLEAEAGLLVNTNHYRSPVMRDYFVETEPQSLQGNTFQRYQKVKDTLTEAYGRIDVTVAKQLMATHAGSLASICRHPLPGSETSTISAMLLLPVQRQMLFCHGQPCQGSYCVFDYS
jgi:isopenicillin-N N-acyltransferase-like protein